MSSGSLKWTPPRYISPSVLVVFYNLLFRVHVRLEDADLVTTKDVRIAQRCSTGTCNNLAPKCVSFAGKQTRTGGDVLDESNSSIDVKLL